MKQVMKSLEHKGIYVPSYDYKGFSIKIQEHSVKLTPKSEQMAIAWIRKINPVAARRSFRKELHARIHRAAKTGESVTRCAEKDEG